MKLIYKKFKSLLKSITVDRKYFYLIENLVPFTKDALNEIAVEFYEDLKIPDNLYWIEFEAFLIIINGFSPMEAEKKLF